MTWRRSRRAICWKEIWIHLFFLDSQSLCFFKNDESRRLKDRSLTYFLSCVILNECGACLALQSVLWMEFSPRSSGFGNTGTHTASLIPRAETLGLHQADYRTRFKSALDRTTSRGKFSPPFLCDLHLYSLHQNWILNSRIHKH